MALALAHFMRRCLKSAGSRRTRDANSGAQGAEQAGQLRLLSSAGRLSVLLCIAATAASACAQPTPAFAQKACADSPAARETVIRLGGEADIEGDDTPIRVHVQLCDSAGAVSGRFTTEDNEFDFAGRREDNEVHGQLSSGRTRGTAALSLSAAGATGRFQVGALKGALRLEPTKRDAPSFIHPAQTIDLTPAQWEEDLNKLVEIVTTKHGSPFTYISKAAFYERVADIRRSIPHSSGVMNALAFRKLLATIGDGHTQVDLLTDRPIFPIETYWFGDGLRLVAAPHDRPELLGAKLVSINGIPISRVTDGLKQYVYQHETSLSFRRSAAVLLPYADLLGDLNITRPGLNRFVFLSGGRRVAALLKAGPATDNLSRFAYKYPLWQRNGGQPWWQMELPDRSIYVNWRSYDGLDENAAALLKQLDARHPKRLLIDLRDNGGGDFNFGRRFIDQLRTRPWLNKRGALYVLVGRRTFSAAMTNAVDFKKTTRAILVGETIGAKPNGWQESRSYFLPNSGIGFSVSIRYYSFLRGFSEVRPDIAIPPRLSDWSDKLDAAVTRVLTLPTSS